MREIVLRGVRESERSGMLESKWRGVCENERHAGLALHVVHVISDDWASRRRRSRASSGGNIDGQ